MASIKTKKKTWEHVKKILGPNFPVIQLASCCFAAMLYENTLERSRSWGKGLLAIRWSSAPPPGHGRRPPRHTGGRSPAGGASGTAGGPPARRLVTLRRGPVPSDQKAAGSAGLAEGCPIQALEGRFGGRGSLKNPGGSGSDFSTNWLVVDLNWLDTAPPPSPNLTPRGGRGGSGRAGKKIGWKNSTNRKNTICFITHVVSGKKC